MGVWGRTPQKKIALFIPRNENFVKYFVLNVNKMPSITVEWNEDNIFMVLKIPLYEGGFLLYIFSKSPKNPLFEGGFIKGGVIIK